MKKVFTITALSMLAATCFAGERNSLRSGVLDNNPTVTNSTTTIALTGDLESIYIDVTAPATQTVTIATATTTLLTATGVTADTLYYPRYAINDAAGAAVGSITNNNTKYVLVSEPITITVTSAQTNTLDTFVTIKTSK